MVLTWPHFSFENIFNFQIALKRTVYAIYQANGRQAVASQSKKSSVMPTVRFRSPIHPGIAGTGIAGTRFPALRNALYLALVPAARLYDPLCHSYSRGSQAGTYKRWGACSPEATSPDNPAVAGVPPAIWPDNRQPGNACCSSLAGCKFTTTCCIPG